MDSKRQKLKDRLEKGERRHEEERFNKVNEAGPSISSASTGASFLPFLPSMMQTADCRMQGPWCRPVEGGCQWYPPYQTLGGVRPSLTLSPTARATLPLGQWHWLAGANKDSLDSLQPPSAPNRPGLA